MKFKTVVITKKKLIIAVVGILFLGGIITAVSLIPPKTANVFNYQNEIYEDILAEGLPNNNEKTFSLKDFAKKILGLDIENPETIISEYSSVFDGTTSQTEQENTSEEFAEDSTEQGEEQTEQTPDTVQEEVTMPDKSQICTANNLKLNNATTYNVDVNALCAEEFSINTDTDGPKVLVVHTHTTECYDGDQMNGETERNTDASMNVVAVGDEICRVLEENGIKTVHDTTYHDYPSYQGSYTRALSTIETQLKSNPTIEIVLDVHRDAFIYSDGSKLAVTCEENGISTAQVMLVVGTNSMGLWHENWQENLKFAACEGAILIVDASQGIEAQTLANTYLAIDHDLEVVPVINKIDLPSAQPEMVINEIEDVIGIPAEDAPQVSAKTGLNVESVLEEIVEKIPSPTGDENAPLKALIFDSYYDSYKGVIVYVRIKEGTVKPGDRIRMMATGAEFDVVEVGVMHPAGLVPNKGLAAGDVGYIAASIKNIQDTRVGDTITTVKNAAAEPLPGYKKVNPMVYSGIYPADGAQYEDLKDALSKLQLNDAALMFEPETSVALGFGFRCGFLGLLHMEIIQERLEREYNLDLVTTAPSVIYKVYKTNGEMVWVDNPTNLPDPAEIDYMEEPMVKATIMVPKDYVGNVMELCQERRGIYKDMTYMDASRAEIFYELPLNEIIYDFFDALKSRTKGYASFDYELCGYTRSNLVKLDILLNGEMVDALSFIVHKDSAYSRGRKMAEKLKEAIPRQLFEVPIQAAVGSKIIARETVRAMRKDVLAKCYGGDITRKKKLLEKQKEGKKRMRQVGSVEVPQEAFMSVLKLDD